MAVSARTLQLKCVPPQEVNGGGTRVPFKAFLALGLGNDGGGVVISEELLDMSWEYCLWRFAALSRTPVSTNLLLSSTSLSSGSAAHPLLGLLPNGRPHLKVCSKSRSMPGSAVRVMILGTHQWPYAWSASKASISTLLHLLSSLPPVSSSVSWKPRPSRKDELDSANVFLQTRENGVYLTS